MTTAIPSTDEAVVIEGMGRGKFRLQVMSDDTSFIVGYRYRS
jgi:hypothetical protein